MVREYFKRIKQFGKVFIRPQPGDCDTKHFYSWLAALIVNQAEFTPACKPKVYDDRCSQGLNARGSAGAFFIFN